MNSGKMLKQIREDKGLTQLEVSKMSGISTNRINKYENGELKPTKLTINLITKAINSNYIDPNICIKIGKNIKLRRTNLGITQKELLNFINKEEKILLSDQSISLVERGRNYSVKIIKYIDDILKLLETKNNIKDFCTPIFKNEKEIIYNIKELHLYNLDKINNFGKILKAARKSHNYSVKYLANLINISSNSIYNYERNARYPQNDILLKLDKYLNLGIIDRPVLSNKRISTDTSLYIIINNIEYRRRLLNISKYELYNSYSNIIFNNFSTARIYIIDKYLSDVENSRGLKVNSIFNI